MDNLIQISDRQTVSARELYEKLGLDTGNWTRWIKTNIQNNPFAVEHQDYEGFLIERNGNQTQDYQLTIEFAKRLCMMARTEKGEQIRNYFIEVEKRFQQLATPKSKDELIMLGYQAAVEKIQLLETKVEEMEPKAEFHDKVSKADGDMSIREAAKVLGTGEKRLFALLRGYKILDSKNIPNQYYIERGYFRLIEKTFFNSKLEEDVLYNQTVVTGKGLIWLKGFLKERTA